MVLHVLSYSTNGHHLAPLPIESESESVATDTTPTRANPSAQVDDELADAVNETEKQTIDEVEDDDDGEAAEDEYEQQYISFTRRKSLNVLR